MAGRVDGPEPDAIAFDDLPVLQVRGPFGQPGVLEDQLGDGQAREALAEMRHAAQMVHVPVGEDHPRGLAPAALAQVAREHVHVLGHARARVDQDGIAVADEIRVGAGARHHAGIEAQDAADPVARCGLPGKIRIDPAHASPPASATPRNRRLISSAASRPAGVPSQTICPLFMT